MGKMIAEKLIRAANKLENPKYPLLGPNLQGLYVFGIWLHGSKLRNYIYCFIHICSAIFVVTEFVDLYQSRKDMMKALLNISITGFGLVAITKTSVFIIMQSKWTEIVNAISNEELSETKKNDPNTMKIVKEYTTYSRTVTYTYWFLVALTGIATMLSPALRYMSSDFRESVRNGTETYPFILSSWFPFNKNQMPGYLVATIVHVYVTFQGAGIVATFDSNAVVVMTFLKGQAKIVSGKCRRLFGEDIMISKEEFSARIKECHRNHNLLMDVYFMLNEALSPVMFIYVLVCSITICCGVVQLTSDKVPTFQKLWVIEFVSAQGFQLFLYCWHSNEVALETDSISRSIFESKYWRGNVQQRRLLILLAGKVQRQYILAAGPFTNLSIPTFVEILKGTYSFYTLFSQMQ